MPPVRPKLAPPPPGYCPQAADTSIETDRLTFALLRRKRDGERLLLGAGTTIGARTLSLQGLKATYARRCPEGTIAGLSQFVARCWLGSDCPPNFASTGTEMNWTPNPIALAHRLRQCFDALGLAYYITGGLAAIAYGEPRSTRDIDIVVATAPPAIAELAAALEADGFYVAGVEDARAGRSRILSATCLETIERADLILSGDSEYDRAKLERRARVAVPEFGAFWFASPEDSILTKLQWQRMGESDKQWRDVLGILKVKGADLDGAYLHRWATVLGVAEALARALVASGVSR